MAVSSPLLTGKQIAVVGLGRSGRAAAALSLRQGASVIGTDARPLAAFGAELEPLQANGIALSLGGHDHVKWDSVDICVVSPGVPALPLFERLQAQGSEVVSELEFGLRWLSAPVAMVGGTNGKSTTTTLLGSMLQQVGRAIFCGGNLGAPVCEAVGQAWDALVLEVSSFQLERSPSIKPQVSVLLNVTEDHLDRYASFADYAQAKGNAFVNQTASDVAIVPAGDALCRQQAERGKAQVRTFGENGDYYMAGLHAVERATGETLDTSTIDLHGTHNRLNLLAAFAAARGLQASMATIRSGATAFVPLAHRMQRVAVKRGVTYYDDSKATNVGAAVTAVAGLSEPRCVVLAGGRDKHGSYAPFVEVLRNKARALVLIGEATERIAAAVGGAVPVVRAGSMAEAVYRAAELSQPGDAVLLSPACSSFDMFTSYAHRGDEFSRAVAALDN